MGHWDSGAHISAKVRLTRWSFLPESRCKNSRDMDPHPVPYRYSDSVIWIVTKNYLLIANLRWKFHANPFGSFCATAKLLTNRQTNR